MRIAIIADRTGPFYEGGAEGRIWNLARELSHRHEVRVFTTLDVPTKIEDGVRFVRVAPIFNQPFTSQVRRRSHEFVFSLLLGARGIGRWRPDVLLVEALPYLHLLPLLLISRRRRLPLVLTVCEAWNRYKFSGTRFRNAATWVISLLLRLGVKGSKRVISISAVTARSLESSYAAHRVEVVPCGVDLEKYAPYQSAHQRAQHSFDVVTVGRLEPIKRQRDLIEALAYMRSKFDWRGRAAIIGDGTLMNSLQEFAAKLGVLNQVAFLGYLDAEERRKVVADAKLFVLTSEREGFSVATLEAQAEGLPAVVARPQFDEVFGVSEVVKEGFNGEYFPVGDAQMLGNKAWGLLSDESRLAHMSHAAILHANEFDWNGIARHLENILTVASNGVAGVFDEGRAYSGLGGE